MKRLLTLLTFLSLSLEAGLTELYDVSLSPYATYIAQKPGDILTVIIDEYAETEDNGDRSQKRTDKNSFSLKDLFIPKLDAREGFMATKGGGDSPALGYESSTDYKAEAKHGSRHEIEAKLQVRIIEQTRVGEFVVRGTRQVMINGKPKKLFVSGIVRQRDITADNTIKSHQIADARIEIEGEINTKDLKPSVFNKFFNWIF